MNGWKCCGKFLLRKRLSNICYHNLIQLECKIYLCSIVDFFGRVKDKAGDVERILKEKDRHGIVI